MEGGGVIKRSGVIRCVERNIFNTFCKVLPSQTTKIYTFSRGVMARAVSRAALFLPRITPLTFSKKSLNIPFKEYENYRNHYLRTFGKIEIVSRIV